MNAARIQLTATSPHTPTKNGPSVVSAEAVKVEIEKQTVSTNNSIDQHKVNPATTEKADNVVHLKPLKQPTLQEFIDATHGKYVPLAFLATVRRDETGTGTGWGGYRAGNEDLSHLDPEAEHYFARGIIRRDTIDKPHSDVNWIASNLLVIDDVGEARKSTSGSNTLDRVRAVLGEPSYVLQSSANSLQVGYIFTEAVTNAAWMDTLRRAVNLKFFDGVEPGGEQRVQWMRLPFGLNLKPGRNRFGVHLTEWAPNRKHKPADLEAKLGDVWETAAANARGIKEGGYPGPRTEDEARAYLKKNPTYCGLDEMGMLSDAKGDGFVRLTQCPWHDEHTAGEDTSVYNPETKAFDCKHGHCTDRTGRDVAEWVRDTITSDPERGPEAWARIIKETSQFPVAVPGVDVDLDDEDADNDNAPTTFKLIPLGKNASTALRRERPRINPLLTRGEVTGLAAIGGGGKGTLMLAMALSIAAGKPELFGDDKPFKYTGDILIVSNEDDAADLEKRRDGWLQRHRVDAGTLTHEPYVVGLPNFKAVEAVGSKVVLTNSMATLAETMKGLRSQGREVCAVVLDTLNTCLEGIEENDNGSVGRAAALLTSWAKRNNVAVLLLHHMPKDRGQTGGAGDAGAMRGASALKDGLRNVVTLTKLDDKRNAKLPPPDQGRVFELTGAKSNHSSADWRRYFIRELEAIEVVDDEGRTGREIVPVMVPYKLQIGWDANSHYARLNVLLHLIEAEDAGEPMRLHTRGKIIGAADRIAEVEEGADAKGISKTLERLAADGLAVQGDVMTLQRKRAKAWLALPKGREWFAAQSSPRWLTAG